MRIRPITTVTTVTSVTTVTAAAVLAVGLVGCSAPEDATAVADASTQQVSAVKDSSNLDTVTTFYEDFFNGHDAAAADVIAQDYIQHNPELPDGRAPFVDFFTDYFEQNPAYRSEIVRTAEDGDLVYLHVHSTNGPDDRGQAVVDIFRVVDGEITEHWDVIQDVPATSANSNTMF